MSSNFDKTARDRTEAIKKHPLYAERVLVDIPPSEPGIPYVAPSPEFKAWWDRLVVDPYTPAYDAARAAFAAGMEVQARRREMEAGARAELLVDLGAADRRLLSLERVRDAAEDYIADYHDAIGLDHLMAALAALDAQP